MSTGPYSYDKMYLMKADHFKKYGPIWKETIVPGVHIVQVFDPKDAATVFRADGDMPLRPVIPLLEVAGKRGEFGLGIGEL